MIEAVIGAIDHAATLDTTNQEAMTDYTTKLRKVMHRRFVVGQGTRDMQGPDGLTTEAFLDTVADRLHRQLNNMPRKEPEEVVVTKPDRRHQHFVSVDEAAIKEMFAKYDKDGDGRIDADEFAAMIIDLGLAPQSTKAL